MAYLEARGVCQEFNGVRVLDGIDIDVEQGRFHILAGENGAGKSTLVKILTGVQRPVAGDVTIGGEFARGHSHLFDQIAYVPQELSLFQNLTVAENLFIPFEQHHSGAGYAFLARKRLEREAERYIEEFHIHGKPSQRVGDVSVSDQQLIQIARAVSRDDVRILILDEPTSSLTTFECERLFKVLRRLTSEGIGIIFISHKMEEIFELGDEFTVLRNGEMVGRGSMDTVDEAGLVRMMAGEDVSLDQDFRPRNEPGEALLTVSGLSDGRFENIDFTLRRGEILGFAGLVGAGRSDVMQSVFGFRPSTAGEIILDGKPLPRGRPDLSVKRGLFYLSEERSHHGIFPQLSVRDNIALTLFDETVRGGLVSMRAERNAVDRIIEHYTIRTSSRDKIIRYLSGGNQQKAIIGRAIARRPDVLIFDEPTKGIDVRTKLQIYELMRDLAEEGVGIILVSSEMNELMKCASRIVAMWHGRITGEFNTSGTSKSQIVSAILGGKEAEDAVA